MMMLPLVLRKTCKGGEASGGRGGGGEGRRAAAAAHSGRGQGGSGGRGARTGAVLEQSGIGNRFPPLRICSLRATLQS